MPGKLARMVGPWWMLPALGGDLCGTVLFEGKSGMGPNVLAVLQGMLRKVRPASIGHRTVVAKSSWLHAG